MAIQSGNVPELITLAGWAGVNQQTKSRSAMNDQECYWQENFFPTAEGQLRTAWGPSAPIYTAPGGVSILRLFFGRVNDTIGPTCLVFKSDGTVDQVQLNAPHTVTALGAAWTPTAPQYFADAKVWSPQQVGFTAGQPGGWAIGSPKGLYAWDGTTLTAPGQTAPTWFSGGGNDPSTGLPWVMPAGLPGIWALEVFGNRLWVMGKTVFSFSAPYNAATYAASNGGGSVGFVGDQLTNSYTDLQAAGGFLYLIGDSMINVISNLQLSGTGTTTNPYTTQFLDSNIDPQVGHRFFRPVGIFSHAFTLYTGGGIYLLQGNQTQQISAKLTWLYGSQNSTNFEPTFAAAHIFGTRWILALGQYTDPYGQARSLMLCWNGQSWTLASQRYQLTHIGTYEENSTLTPYGTDGSSLYQLFAQPDPALVKTILTKQYKGPHLLMIKDWKRAYAELQDYYGGPGGVSLRAVLSTGGGGIPNGQQGFSFELAPGGYANVGAPTAGAGIWAALDLTTLSPDFAIESIMLEFDERTKFGA